jgi:plastocyanin
MKNRKDVKILAITAFVSTAALLTLFPTSPNAGQREFSGFRTYGFDRIFTRPALPGHLFIAPAWPTRHNDKQPAQPKETAIPSANTRGTISGTTNVAIVGMQFLPSTIRIKAGQEVAWTNKEPIIHALTSPNNGLLASERLGLGSIYRHTFETPGIYTYYCALLPSMRGLVIVE